MSEKVENEPFLSVDFGHGGGRFDWMSDREAEVWVSQLRDQWSWLSSIGQNATNQAWKLIVGAINNSVNSIQQARNSAAQNQAAQVIEALNNARSHLEGFVKKNLWILPGTARYKFIEEVKDSGKTLEAGLVVAAWMPIDLNGAPIRQVVWALLQIEMFERGSDSRIFAEDSALSEISGKLQSSLTELKALERAQKERFETLHDQIFEQSSGQKEIFELDQSGREETWKTALDETQRELDALKETYDKHMALAAPVEYWENKRKKHGRWTLVSFVATFICMLLVGLTLHSELQAIGKAVESSQSVISVKQSDPKSVGTQPAQTSGKEASENASDRSNLQSKDVGVSVEKQGFLESAATWKIGSFVLLATLCFWFIRLLVRIFLSNLHLENDAAERVTMAKTYLALIRDSALNNEGNISTVLAALFRPTGDGIVKDEGLPPTAMEWLTKLGGK